jgi:hypothetical protein
MGIGVGNVRMEQGILLRLVGYAPTKIISVIAAKNL